MPHDGIGKKQRSSLYLILVFAFLVIGNAQPLAAAPDDGVMAALKKEAAKEGKLLFYTSLNLEYATAFTDRFQKKYPFIKVELFRSNSMNLFNRVLGEQRAKKNTVDVMDNKGDIVHLLQKLGLLAKYLSPEREGYAEAFKEKDGYWTASWLMIQSLVYNRRMVSPQDAPVTYQDLLKPQWKGKIGFNTLQYMWLEGVMQTMGKDKGVKFLEALARQNPMVRDGGTLNAILTAAGELSMAVPINIDTIERLRSRGAPLEWSRIKPYYGDIHSIALVANAPHPNASKLFIDYVLSPEGQELMGAIGNIPARRGLKAKIINSEEINPIDPAQGSEKSDYYQKLLKQIFAKKVSSS